MPDDRLIHLAFGQSEKINKLTALERDVWLVYKLAADDFGVMRFSATPLQDAARWLERQPSKRILQALTVVRDVGLVQSFDHQGQGYIFDPVWQTWQKITHPRQTKQPRPSGDVLDLNTRWLFEHHPRGGKLKSWQAPEQNREKTGSLPGGNREETGRTPGEEPKHTSPVLVGNGGVRVSGGGSSAAAAPNGRSKRPVYTSDRFGVFEWQFDELSKMLGPHFEAFDLHSFFDGLTQQSRADGLVIPKPEAWDWLQAQVLTEARRRGLPMAGAAPSARDKAAEQRAQDERVLALVQQDRVPHAGR